MAFLAKLITIHYIFRASSKRLFQPIFHPNLENETIQKIFFEEIVRDALMVDIYIYICFWIHNIFVNFMCFGTVKPC